MSFRPYSAIVAAAQASNSKLTFPMANDSGSAIAIYQPVCLDGSGKIKDVDVSVEQDSLTVLGISTQAISNGSYGTIITHGRLENISTALNFGDYVYVSKAGGLTSTLPNIGVDGFLAGDFVIRVGLIVKNKDIPAQKDLVVNLELIGQL